MKTYKYFVDFICSETTDEVDISYWVIKPIRTSELIQGKGRNELYMYMKNHKGDYYVLDGAFFFTPLLYEALSDNEVSVQSKIPNGNFIEIVVSDDEDRIFSVRNIWSLVPQNLGADDIFEMFGFDYRETVGFSNSVTCTQCIDLINEVLVFSALYKKLEDSGLRRLTLGSNSYYKFQKSYKSDEFATLFPHLDNDTFNSLRLAYRGGKCILNPWFKGYDIRRQGYNLDRKSLYPTIAQNRALPVKLPRYRKGRANPSKTYPLYIQHIRCYYFLKDDCCPVANNDTDRDKQGFALFHFQDLYFTQAELPYFFKNYEVFNLEYVEAWEFQTRKGIFDEYFNDIDNMELPRSFRKGLKNTLLSKFAQKKNVKNYCPYLDKSEKICYNIVEEDTGIDYYIPISIFINSYGRCVIYDIIEKCGGLSEESIFAYCDTDSAHIICQDIPYFFNENLWTCKNSFTHAYFEKPKTYMERDSDYTDIHIVGVPLHQSDVLTANDFYFSMFEKKRKDAKKGGISFVPQKIEHKVRKE